MSDLIRACPHMLQKTKTAKEDQDTPNCWNPESGHFQMCTKNHKGTGNTRRVAHSGTCLL